MQKKMIHLENPSSHYFTAAAAGAGSSVVTGGANVNGVVIYNLICSAFAGGAVGDGVVVQAGTAAIARAESPSAGDVHSMTLENPIFVPAGQAILIANSCGCAVHIVYRVL